ncbi:hypothetical protein VKS41_006057 [Umbelopsis sp. WA50703]
MKLFFILSILISAIGLVFGDSKGQLLYTPTDPKAEFNQYARIIKLEHAGNLNGRLLAIFEHWPATAKQGAPAHFILRSSDDHGSSWSTLATVEDPMKGPGHPASFAWEPFLFEYPQTLGKYPEGTLLLVANMLNKYTNITNFMSWRSPDHGKTWNPIGIWQNATGAKKCIWEPFLALDSKGRLLAYFSDEREEQQHSQMLVHVTSTDGGDTWGSVVRDVVSSVPSHRPGMATVARMGSQGKYVMSYEVCNDGPNCPAHYKFSDDGYNWNPSDLGQAVLTSDNRYPGHSPYVAYVQETDKLVLSSHLVFLNTSNSYTSESKRSIFIKASDSDVWHWAPAPWSVSNASTACNSNYSPDLMPIGSDGIIRYTAPTSIGSSGACGEGTGIAPVGVLPYHSDFSTSGDAGWNDFDGTWTTTNGVYKVDTGSRPGAKALTGTTGWTAYAIDVDIMVDTAKDAAGVLGRITNPGMGTNLYHGYSAVINTGTGTFFIARQAATLQTLATTTVKEGLQSNVWYHIHFELSQFQFKAVLTTKNGSQLASLTTTDTQKSFGNGMAGLRVQNGSASFQNFVVVAST